MPSGVREPNLSAAHQAQLVALVQQLDEALRPFVPPGERDPRIARGLVYLQPSELFALASDLARDLADHCNALLNGAKVRDGSEPSGWRGSLRAGSDEVASMAARFGVANNREAESIIRTACRSFDELMHRAMFGTSAMSREQFVRNHLHAAGLLRGVR